MKRNFARGQAIFNPVAPLALADTQLDYGVKFPH